MFDLKINDTSYSFNFGFGFIKEINSRVQMADKGLKQNVGLRYAIIQVIQGDIETLFDVLLVANKGCSPRLTAEELEKHLSKDTTDVDELFESVLDFLKQSNFTKKTMTDVMKDLEEEKNRN